MTRNAWPRRTPPARSACRKRILLVILDQRPECKESCQHATNSPANAWHWQLPSLHPTEPCTPQSHSVELHAPIVSLGGFPVHLTLAPRMMVRGAGAKRRRVDGQFSGVCLGREANDHTIAQRLPPLAIRQVGSLSISE